MSEENLPKTTHLPILDFVRAAATMAVFIFHTGYLVPFAEPNVLARVSEHGFINWHRLVYVLGTVGVSVFFVLSGFLLFYQIYKQHLPFTKKEIKTYTKKRLLRILPLYYFSLITTLFFLKPDIWFLPDGIRSIVYNIIFFRGPFGGGSITINPVYWSLIIELHFYLLLPIFYIFFYRIRKLWVFFVPIIMGLIYRTGLTFFLPETTNMQLLRLTPANFDYFAIGMLGAYFFIERPKWLAALGRTHIQIMAITIFFVFIYLYDLEFTQSLSYIFAPVFFGIIVTINILSLLLHDRSILARAFTISPVLFIAKISFGIYIWHALVIEITEYATISNNIKLFLNCLITLAISAVTYYAIEAPFLRRKKVV